MLSKKPLNLDECFKPIGLISDPNPIDISSIKTQGQTFTSEGVFSPRVFGSLGNNASWNCDCGALEGHFNEGVTCEECDSEVTFKGASLGREGWIKLNHVQIHPLMYRHILKVIGKSAVLKVLKYRSEIEGGGSIIEVEMKPPYHGIGIQAFYENFEEVMLYYHEARKTDPKEYNFIMQNKNIVFCNYLPIINSRLRPATVIDGEFSFDRINVFYNALLRNSQMLEELTDIERVPINTQAIAFKSQMHIVEIYDTIIDMVSSKEGAIRNGLLGNRLNFTSRMVITPLGWDASLDEVHIPYIAALELFKPAILQKLSSLKNISLTQAEAIWTNATRKFSPLIYKIMEQLRQLPNVAIICNRNPTISLGSIFLLRIGGIKKDLSDKTASLHNLLLSSLGGDYDGDVLNFALVLGDEFVEWLEPLRPHNILIDVDQGGFNSAFLPLKDTLLGLISLFS